MKLKLGKPSFKKKKKGGDGEEQPKKKLSKKNLLIIIVVLLLAAVAAKFTVFKNGLPPLPFGGGGGTSQAEAKLPDPVDAYCLLDDSVASISSSFEAAGAAEEGTEGEESEEKKEDKKEKEDKAAKGAEEVLLSMSTSYVPEPEGEEGEEGKEEAAEAEEPAEENAILEANRPEGEYGYYYYRVGAGTEGTLAKYREFLLDDGFKLLENANADKPYVTKYQKEGVTPKKYFNLEIEYPLGGDAMTGMYAIKVSMEDKPDPVEQEAVGREETLEYFNTLSHEKLGLPKPVSEYYVVMDMGRTFVDGHDCHGISLYEKGNGAGNYFIKKFYLSLEDKKLFEYMGDSIYTMEYNPQTGQTTSTIGDEFNRQSVNSGGTVHNWDIGPVE